MDQQFSSIETRSGEYIGASDIEITAIPAWILKQLLALNFGICFQKYTSATAA